MAHPLYESTQGPKMDPLDWTQEMNQAFQTIKKCPDNGPSPRNISTYITIFLYVAERKGVAVEVLIQKLGPET
jgi:hypothetical protein